MAAEGRLEDEAPGDRPEEEEAFGVEPAFTHNKKDFSPITYKALRGICSPAQKQTECYKEQTGCYT